MARKKSSLGSLITLTLFICVLFLFVRSCRFFPLGPRFQYRGPSMVTLDKNNGYRLLVDGKPYVVKGVCYSPIPVGKDGDYNFWADINRPWLLDGKLLKAMGANTVRFYRPGKNPAQVKQALDDFYYRFGIRAMMGTYLGFWGWPPPNYADGDFCRKVRQEFLDMVKLYKDSPGVLLWVLGNENNYSFDRNVQPWTSEAIEALPNAEAKRKEKARIYYAFVNSVAKEVKRIDPNHPVALGVGETRSLEIARKECPDVDMIGMIAYRGFGFGNLFRDIKGKFDLPVLVMEWGADGFNSVTQRPDEEMQARYLRQQWREINENADPRRGAGNCLGGTVFEWNDEWWKSNDNLPPTWSVHDTVGHWRNVAYSLDGNGPEPMNMNEEWWGIVQLDPKKRRGGLDARVPKKSYYLLKSFWEKEP